MTDFLDDIFTAVVIPVRNEKALTAALIEQLVEYGGWHHLYVFDNGSDDGTGQMLVEWRDAIESDPETDRKMFNFYTPTHSIYEMWNQGWHTALTFAENGSPACPVNVAFLNNDITIPPGFLQVLTRTLRQNPDFWITYPDYTRRVEAGLLDGGLTETQGTFSHGGLCGWAFVLAGEKHHHGLPMVDEQYRLWYGDDDLERSVRQHGGKIGRVNGLPLDHVGSVTANKIPDRQALIDADKQYHDAKWNA